MGAVGGGAGGDGDRDVISAPPPPSTLMSAPLPADLASRRRSPASMRTMPPIQLVWSPPWSTSSWLAVGLSSWYLDGFATWSWSWLGDVFTFRTFPDTGVEHRDQSTA